MQTFRSFRPIIFTTLLLFGLLSCNNQADLTSYNALVEDLQNPLEELGSKQMMQFLDQVISISKSLPLAETMIGEEEFALSSEKGQLLMALIKSELTDEQLAYIFQKANFNNTYLKDEKLENANLQGIVLTNAYLSNVTLSDVNLSHSTLTNTRIARSYIMDSNFDNASCRGINFEGSNINNTTFKSGYLRNASFGGVALSQVNLEGANTSGTESLEEALDRKLSTIE